MAWWAWLIAAAVLGGTEVLSGEFVLLMLSGGALLTTVAAIGVGWLWVQLLVFAVTSLVLVFGLRPALKRHFIGPEKLRSGIEALVGSDATVIETVGGDGGQVKIGGEVWSAELVAEGDEISPGTAVTVVEIRGATAVVMPGL